MKRSRLNSYGWLLAYVTLILLGQQIIGNNVYLILFCVGLSMTGAGLTYNELMPIIKEAQEEINKLRGRK